jgi:hypothetical protein
LLSSQELCLLDYTLLEVPPTHQAAAALLLAMHTHGTAGAQAPRLLRLARVEPAALARAAGRLVRIHRDAARPPTEALGALLAPIVSKYSRPSWCHAALCAPLDAVDPAWCSC